MPRLRPLPRGLCRALPACGADLNAGPCDCTRARRTRLRIPWPYRRENSPSPGSACAAATTRPPACRPRPVRAAATPAVRTASARICGYYAGRKRSRSRTTERDPRRARRDGGRPRPAGRGRGRRSRRSELPPDVLIQLVGKADVIEAELATHPGRGPEPARDRAGRRSHRDGGEAARGRPQEAQLQRRRRARAAEGRRSDAFISAGNTGAVLAASTLLLGLHRRRRAGHRRDAVPHRRSPGARARRRRQRRLLRPGAGRLRAPRHGLRAGRAGAGQPAGRAAQHRRRGGEGERGRPRRRTGCCKQAAGLNFIGNIEGRDILAGHSKLGHVDVVVCDGFVGNIVLKFYESVAPPVPAAGRARARRTSCSEPTCRKSSACSTTPSTAARRCSACRASPSSATAPPTPDAIQNAIRVAVQAVHTGLTSTSRRSSPRARPPHEPPPIAAIAGLGVAVPDRVVTNADFEKMLETSDQWIVERTGIRERHIAGPEETRGHDRARRLAPRPRAGRDRPRGPRRHHRRHRHPGPAASRRPPATCRRCSARRTPPRSTSSAACPGWVYGLTVAEGLIASGQGDERPGRRRGEAQRASPTRPTGPPRSCSATAPARRSSGRAARRQRGILSTFLKSDGTLAELLYRPGGGAVDPISEKVVAERRYYLKMAGREVFKSAVLAMADACDQALTARRHHRRPGGPAGARTRPTSGSSRPRRSTPASRWSKVFVNVDRYGNTSSASIPLALDEAISEGRLKPGSIVLLVAFGAGLHLGSAVVRW